MLTMYAISDSIGETAAQVANAAASQFKEKVEVKRIPYVKTLEDVDDVIKTIDACCDQCMVISTVITVNVREFLTQKCVEKNINIINVLGPIINVASNIINTLPDYNPGAMWKTDEVYFKRIEAMEFAMQYDDSKDYRGLKKCRCCFTRFIKNLKNSFMYVLSKQGYKSYKHTTSSRGRCT